MNYNQISVRTTVQKHWKVRRSRRKGWSFEVVNGLHDTVAVVYGDKAEAELLASAPQQHAAAQELRACTKQLVAILGLFEERLVQSERAALDRARVLTAC